MLLACWNCTPFMYDLNMEFSSSAGLNVPVPDRFVGCPRKVELSSAASTFGDGDSNV
jgi:hypothetical protein